MRAQLAQTRSRTRAHRKRTRRDASAVASAHPDRPRESGRGPRHRTVNRRTSNAAPNCVVRDANGPSEGAWARSRPAHAKSRPRAHRKRTRRGALAFTNPRSDSPSRVPAPIVPASSVEGGGHRTVNRRTSNSAPSCIVRDESGTRHGKPGMSASNPRLPGLGPELIESERVAALSPPRTPAPIYVPTIRGKRTFAWPTAHPERSPGTCRRQRRCGEQRFVAPRLPAP